MREPTAGEAAFLFTWVALGGKPDAWVREYRWAAEYVGPGRGVRARLDAAGLQDWRADFAHLPSRVLVEIEGGGWTRGRHHRPEGYADDCRKYNAAQRLGYDVYRLTTEMASDPDEVGRIMAATRGEEVDDGE